MFKRLLARLFGRKPKNIEITNTVTISTHDQKINQAMIVEIAKRKPQQIHRNTFVSGPARNPDGIDTLSPLHPAYFATMADSDDSRSHSCHSSHSSHDSSSYDSGSSDSGSSSGGGCD